MDLFQKIEALDEKQEIVTFLTTNEVPGHLKANFKFTLSNNILWNYEFHLCVKKEIIRNM